MKYMVAAVCMLVVVGVSRAEDKANPNGAWKYTAEVNGQSIEVTIKLKQDGHKLTGTVNALNMAMKIQDGKYENGVATFKVSSEVNGSQFSIKYHGKISGDTFKGKRTIERDGQATTREFVAKRSKE